MSTIDLKSGYWQVPLAKVSRPITAFAIPSHEQFQFRVMPFGLHSAPATFQRLLDQIIGPDLAPRAFAYLDDIVILGRTIEEHLKNLCEVFQRLRRAHLRINAGKCQFVRESLIYLRYIVDKESLRTDPEKIRAIVEFPRPQTVTELRRFMEVASWYRRFIKDIATVGAALNVLLTKKAWEWEDAQEETFQNIKAQLATASVLHCPDFSQPFTLQIDASDVGLGVA